MQLTSFVGREDELAAVVRLLRADRLLTLTGAGGVGKTRLALEAAAQVEEDYPQGVWLVDLGVVADPVLVPQAVAGAVGVRETPSRALLATLLDALRPQRVLLVLDNCEHLLEPCARLAEALLHACPHLTVLATSRAPLGLAGEQPWRVPSLALPDADAIPSAAGLGSSAAVRLFAERARTVRPRFGVTDQNAPAVARICRRLDGIPLALELAAALVRVLSVEQLVERVEDRFRLLTGGSRTALPRHQTLRAAVDWSYDLLSPPERTLFERLAAFAGSWTLEAAEAVCASTASASDTVLGLLTRLVDQSLVVVEEHPAAAVRFRLLETLRQYAREKLRASGAADAVYRCHADHYLQLAEVPDAEWRGPAQVAWLARLEQEHGNLRAALHWAAARGDADRALRLGAPLGVLWRTRSRVTEGQASLGTLLALPDGPGRPARERAARASVLISAARLTRTRGDYAAARAHLEESLTIARTLGHAGRVGIVLYHLGNVLRDAGDVAAARPLFEESLAVGRALADDRIACAALFGLGAVALQVGDDATAQAVLEDSVAIAQTTNRDVEVSALVYLGVVATRRGEFALAGDRFAASLAANRPLGNQDYLATILDLMAGLPAAQGDYARALRVYGAVDALNERLGARLDALRQAERQHWLAQAERALSRAAREAAWAEGRTMSPQEAVAGALAAAASSEPHE